MPLCNGSFCNWTLNLTQTVNGINNGTASATHFVTLVPVLLPWLVSFFIIGMYFVMFYALRSDESRWKFVTVTFVPMFISIIFAIIGWVNAGIPALTVSVFVLTAFIVIATTG